jgi:hypothetical protein
MLCLYMYMVMDHALRPNWLGITACGPACGADLNREFDCVADLLCSFPILDQGQSQRISYVLRLLVLLTAPLYQGTWIERLRARARAASASLTTACAAVAGVP